jgi:DNA-binding NarL/FixJ family response regulator
VTAIGAFIVDDHEDMRVLIRMIIEDANRGLFVSGEAVDGEGALDALDAADPAIVVLDEMMPGISGLETAVLILRRRPEQRIILCSAYLDDALQTRAKDAGVTVCMSKAHLTELPVVIRRVIAAA